MATNNEIAELLIRLDECMNGKGGVMSRLDKIDSHLMTLNGSVSETIRKLALTEKLAKEATGKARFNQAWIWGLAIAVIGILGAIISQLV